MLTINYCEGTRREVEGSGGQVAGLSRDSILSLKEVTTCTGLDWAGC